ncbi:MAG: FAD-binding oxidoreductase [Rhizobiales bacterium]|nr:FAD-binding oxidoreductase [Hyphomicrobiales bacterium]
MTQAPYDVIIVGQGLAGTTLAWHLREAGQQVLILDRQEAVTSSKIAAGLITPITGQRLTLSWRIDEFLPLARYFYRRIEKLSGKKFFHDRMAVRLFKSEEEQQNWKKRDKQPMLNHLMGPTPTVLLDPALGSSEHGGFAMHAAQLDVADFLETSRTFLTWQKAELDWQTDVDLVKVACACWGIRPGTSCLAKALPPATTPIFHACRLMRPKAIF